MRHIRHVHTGSLSTHGHAKHRNVITILIASPESFANGVVFVILIARKMLNANEDKNVYKMNAKNSATREKNRSVQRKKFVIFTTITARFVFPDVDANMPLNVTTNKFVEDIPLLENRCIAKPHKNAAKIILVVHMRNVEIMCVRHLKTACLTKIVQARNVSKNSAFVLSLSNATHRMTVSVKSFVIIILLPLNS